MNATGVLTLNQGARKVRPYEEITHVTGFLV